MRVESCENFTKFQLFELANRHHHKCFTGTVTALKVYVFVVVLIRIFPHSDCIWKNTEYLSVFSPNTGKNQPENLQIRTNCFSVNGS